MKFSLSLVFIFCVAGLLPQQVQGYDFNAGIRKKQEAKEAKRWSLSEWLAQKSKVKLMDTWLSYNEPSPYEFYLSLDTSNIEQEVSTGVTTLPSQSYRNYRGALAAYVTMVGLYGEYESSDEELEQWKALFLLRLIGSSDQSTNLTIHYGLMGQDFNNDKTQFQLGGGRLNFYFIRAFGITGLYEYIFEATSEQDIVMEGFRWEAGAFIEYGALRIYGSWYQESMDMLTPALVESTRSRQGILYGLRFYF